MAHIIQQLYFLQPSYSQPHNNAPTPPVRRNSLMSSGQNSADQYSGTFEGRFSSMFKTPQFLPPPEPFTASAKTYPSRNTGGNSTLNNINNYEGREITFLTENPKQWKSRKAFAAPKASVNQ